MPKKLIFEHLEIARNSALFRHVKFPLECLLNIAVSLCTPIKTSELLSRFL